jgi:ferredoxin-NADP reductase
MIKEHIVKILKMDILTHNVKSFIIEKPESYNFISGQATNVSINNELKDKKRPFTFTSTDNDKVIEFIIKRYPNGITEKMHSLKSGDKLIIGEVFGYFNYNGEGTFIAGGTGITPFLSIFRNLNGNIKGNKLIFSNKEHRDILCERELKEIFNENVKFLLTEENKKGYLHKRIDKNFLKKEINNFNQQFYICGPPSFVEDIKSNLIKLGTPKERILAG